jgi:IS30 family transposase
MRQTPSIRSIDLPTELFRSLTWDQGKEMAPHQQFTIDTGVQVYFCDPNKPLATRLEREHQRAAAPVLPQGRSFAALTQDDLDQVAARLNGRPRQTLNWKTPSQVLVQALR